MLSFVDSLKQVIADVQATGGAIVERSLPSSNLLQRLREYVVQRLSETQNRSSLLEDWFIDGFFDEKVRICVIHLHKFAIVDNDVIYRVMIKVLNRTFFDKDFWRDATEDFEGKLVDLLCILWAEQMGDEQTFVYTFAQKRWLITWDYQRSCWKTTSLGEIFQDLPPIQAATLLLSIDILFSTGEFDFRHISGDVLKNLLSSAANDVEVSKVMLPHQEILTHLSILRLSKWSEDENEQQSFKGPVLTLTPLGKTVLHQVLDEDNPLRDTASVILETEKLGGSFKNSTLEINEVLELVKRTDLIDEANRKAVHTGVKLYRAGDYLSSLRQIFPTIEAIINGMLIKAGESLTNKRFQGLAKKTEYLGQRGIIPLDISSAVEIFTARNKLLHGNFSPPENYVFPLCLLAFLYLRRLLTNCHPV